MGIVCIRGWGERLCYESIILQKRCETQRFCTRVLKSRGNDVTVEDANRAMTGAQLTHLGITNNCMPGCGGVWHGCGPTAGLHRGAEVRAGGTVVFWQSFLGLTGAWLSRRGAIVRQKHHHMGGLGHDLHPLAWLEHQSRRLVGLQHQSRV